MVLLEDGASNTEEELVSALSHVLLHHAIEGLDDDLVAYMAGILSSTVAEDPALLEESVGEVLIPFLESVQCPEALVEQAEQAVLTVLRRSFAPADATTMDVALLDASNGHDSTHINNTSSGSATRKLQQGVIQMSLHQHATANDKDSARHLWGMEQGVKPMANTLIDAHADKSSVRDKRKQRKADTQQQRLLLSSATDQDTDHDERGLVHMNVRAFSANQTTDKTRDVQVRNVTVALNNGTILLESGELKMAYQRRYGLIGENGVGKCWHRIVLLNTVRKNGPMERL